jgi:hypothetical protein
MKNRQQNGITLCSEILKMDNQQTPKTKSHVCALSLDMTGDCMICAIERERDEARADAAKIADILSGLELRSTDELASLERERNEARAERDILRLDAQREAEHHDRMVGELQRLYAKLEEARAVAGELADVASKHLSFLLAVTPAKTNETHEKETMKVIAALKRWKKL